jgi:hypothetical protein
VKSTVDNTPVPFEFAVPVMDPVNKEPVALL